MRHLITDLDDTLVSCQPYYTQALGDAGRVFEQRLGITSDVAISLIRAVEAMRAVQEEGFRVDRLFDSAVDAASIAVADREDAEMVPLVLIVVAELEVAFRIIREAPYPLLPQVRETLETYRDAGWRIHCWTKGEPDFQLSKIRHAKLHEVFDKTHVVPKKNATRLQQLIDALPAGADVTVVGDSYKDDISSALAVGVTAVWVTETGAEAGWGDIDVVSTFAELPTVLPPTDASENS